MQHFFLLLVAAIILPAKQQPNEVCNKRVGKNLELPVLQQTGDKQIRFYKNHSYEIIDTAGFILYFGSKEVPKMPNKAPMKIEQYFFSKTLTDDIEELNINNLEKRFPENIRFHYALEQEFCSDKNLAAYDNYTKQYKVKYLYYSSIIK